MVREQRVLRNPEPLKELGGEEESAWLSARALDSKGILLLAAVKLSWSLVSGGNMGLVDLSFHGFLCFKHLEFFHSLN